jgi:hypothetical protein
LTSVPKTIASTIPRLAETFVAVGESNPAPSFVLVVVVVVVVVRVLVLVLVLVLVPAPPFAPFFFPVIPTSTSRRPSR